MAVGCISGISIRGIVTAIPRNEASIAKDDAHLFDGNQQQIERLKQTIGLDRRRVADDQTTAADLAEKAARHLLEKTGRQPDEIDGLIMVTQTPDHLQPGNAVLLQGRLGIPDTCACMDINLGCSGYVYGLWTVQSLMASGGLKRVIFIVGDTISKIVSSRDRSLRPLFGDAASATLLEHDPEAKDTLFELRSDGTGYKSLWQPAGGFREPVDPDKLVEEVQDEGIIRNRYHLHMDGADIFNFSLKVELPAIQHILHASGWKQESVDGFVFHQANRYIIENIRRRLKLPAESVPSATVERYGNQSGASIPATLSAHYGKKLTERSHRFVFSGFGVGLSWATCAIVLPALICNELIEV